jgi:hypothetical protein
MGAESYQETGGYHKSEASWKETTRTTEESYDGRPQYVAVSNYGRTTPYVGRDVGKLTEELYRDTEKWGPVLVAYAIQTVLSREHRAVTNHFAALEKYRATMDRLRAKRRAKIDKIRSKSRHTCKACSASLPVRYLDDDKCGVCKAPVVPAISADSTRVAWAPVARTLVSMENAHNRVVAKLNAAHAKKTDAYNTKLAKHRERVAEIQAAELQAAEQLAETQKTQEMKAEAPRREGTRKRKHVDYAEHSDSDDDDESFEPPSNKRSKKKLPSKPQPPQPPNVVGFRAESMVIGWVAY